MSNLPTGLVVAASDRWINAAFGSVFRRNDRIRVGASTRILRRRENGQGGRRSFLSTRFLSRRERDGGTYFRTRFFLRWLRCCGLVGASRTSDRNFTALPLAVNTRTCKTVHARVAAVKERTGSESEDW